MTELEKNVKELVEQFYNNLVTMVTQTAEDLGKLLEKEGKPKTVWDLEEGDEYYFLNYQNVVTKSIWHEYPSHEAIRNAGNAFLSKEEAQIEGQKREIETLLQKYGGVPFRNLEHVVTKKRYYFMAFEFDEYHYIEPDTFELSITNQDCKEIVNFKDVIPFAFKSEADAENALNKIGEQRLIAYARGKLFEND